MMVVMVHVGRRPGGAAMLLWVCAAALAAACGRPGSTASPSPGRSPSSSAPSMPAPAATTASADVAAEVQRVLEQRSGADRDERSRAVDDDVARFYRSRGFRLAWSNDDGQPTSDAGEAAALFADAASDALNPDDYRVTLMPELAHALTADPASSRVRAAFDVAMSTAVLRYYRHLHVGRVDPESIGFRTIRPDNAHDFVVALQGALEAHRVRAAAADLAPPFELYRRLRQALARYRELAAASDAGYRWTGPSKVEAGQEFEGAPALSRRLALFGDLVDDDERLADAEPSATRIYGPGLVEAVRRFQRRHGLTDDGVIGRSTIAALNEPLDRRVRQIELALERLRWLPHLGPGRFIGVNIPMFRLWAWDNLLAGGIPTFSTGVIVGRAPGTRTPVLASEMAHLIFRPYWNVPASIARAELIPAWREDAAYFDAHNLEIVSGATDDAVPVPATPETVADVERGRLRLRQRPGPGNSLGLVKFIFPNEESVYLHATPATELFSRARRDFSHGCVRVENPVGLAEWLLAGDANWDRAKMVAAMQGTRPTTVGVAGPVQVVLFYITAAAMPEDGALHFADDIYGHDALLERALARRGT